MMAQASHESMTPEARRYARATGLCMAGYGCCIAAAVVVSNSGLSPAVSWFSAAAVSFPLIVHIVALLRYLREADEYVASVQATRFITSAGATFGLATFWGFAETFADAPHIAGWWVYPVFWFCFGVMSCLRPMARDSAE